MRRRTLRRRLGSRRQTGRGGGRGAGRRGSGARPRAARRTTGARGTGHGTASGRWRHEVGAGRGGDRRVGASGRDGRVNGCAGGRGDGDGDVRRGAGWLRRRQPPTMRGEESKIEIQNQNALRSSSPLTPRRSRPRAIALRYLTIPARGYDTLPTTFGATSGSRGHFSRLIWQNLESRSASSIFCVEYSRISLAFAWRRKKPRKPCLKNKFVHRPAKQAIGLF